MTTNRWWEYVQTVIGDDTALKAGTRAGFDASAFTRWKKGGLPDVFFVIKLARAYRRNVLEAMAAAGFITDEEAGLHTIKAGREDFTLEELAEEMLLRVRSLNA